MSPPMRRRRPTRRGAAILLRAGYGMCIFCGLREVEHLAPAHELGGLAIPYLSHSPARTWAIPPPCCC